MPRDKIHKLTFRDAVRILDGESSLVAGLDKLIMQIFDLVPGGKLLGLPYVTFREKIVEYANGVVGGIYDRVHGLGRLDRTERLYAAHAVIVMTAFTEALGEELNEFRLLAGESRQSAAPEPWRHIRWFDQVIPAPVSVGGVPGRGNAIYELYLDLALAVDDCVMDAGLQSIQGNVDRSRHLYVRQDMDGLAYSALRRYEEYFRKLIAAVPEFAAWAYLGEHQATRADLAELGGDLLARLETLTTGLSGIPELLEQVSGRTRTNQVRSELADAYADALTRSVLGDTRPPEGITLPSLADGYVNPACRATVIDADALPADDEWWDRQPRYDDVQALLVATLTSLDTLRKSLVVLGQPGAGKSVLTRMLAARLADRGFMPVRVELRDVPADAEVQPQVEQAIRKATGREVQWPDLAVAAHNDGLLPLIILDGFDELLQATGVNRSGYLEQVAEFQRRESGLGRPVATIVTSRTAVADRARFPDGGLVVRLEPFDESRVRNWLGVWNTTNADRLAARGIPPLSAETVLSYGELAEQPLLLILLALYDADAGALQGADAELSRAELYDRLLTDFARREVRKPGTGIDAADERRAIATELRRLSIAALAMFNRHAQVIAGADLDRDLVALLPNAAGPVRTDSDLANKPLTAAQLTVGRFFFVHESQAQRGGEAEHAYEFLHATFGEFLVARLVVETLRGMARLRAFQESEGIASTPDDSELWAQLSFAALAGTAARVEFVDGLLARLREDERADVRALSEDLLHAAPYARPGRSNLGYEPWPIAAFQRHAYYSANLTLLAVLASNEPLDFHPRDTGVWQEAFFFDEFVGMLNAVRMFIIPGGDEHQLLVGREDGSEVDPYDFGLIQRDYGDEIGRSELFAEITLRASSESGSMVREAAFSPRTAELIGNFLPYLQFVGDVSDFGGVDGGVFVPASRALLELRLAPFSAHGLVKRERIYRWCFDNLLIGPPAFGQTILRQLREDVRDFPGHIVAELLVVAFDYGQLNVAADAFCEALLALRDADAQGFQIIGGHIRDRMNEVPEDGGLADRMRAFITPTDNPQK